VILGVVRREKDTQHAALSLVKNGRHIRDGRLGSLLSDQPIPPTFSVISMRPSGRKAIRQGRLRVATWTMLKGRLGSGFCSPALICASAWVAARARNSPAISNCFISSFPLSRINWSGVSKRWGGLGGALDCIGEG
jgi:hypothetical protein